jgi:adenosylcobinamide-GDP ribazoletransferase
MTTLDEGAVAQRKGAGVQRGYRARSLRVELLAATSILTRLPVASTAEAAGAGFFGLVGALLGAGGAMAILVLGSIAPAVAAILAIAVIVGAAGALHLDGLADTADALVAPTEAAAERARADPRAGAAGMVAIVVVLIADWSLCVALIERLGIVAAASAFVVAGGVSRAAAALAPHVTSLRFRPGFGAWFAERATIRDGLASAVSAALVAAGLGAVVGRPGLAIAGIAGMLGGLAWIALLARLRHGLDGDALGAGVELTFGTTLLAVLLVA